MGGFNPISWVEDAWDAVTDTASSVFEEVADAFEEVADFTGDAVQEVADFTGDAVQEAIDFTGDAVQETIDFTGDVVGTAYHETMAFTADVTGIDELDPDYNEDLEAEYMAQLAAQQAEFARLEEMKRSASAVDRMRAEKKLAILKGSHDKWMRQSRANFRRRKLQGDIEHRKAMAEREAEINKAAREKSQQEIGYDKEAMKTIARQARDMPTIPAMSTSERGVGETTRDTPPRRPR
tara:strand:- start:1266 stop:1976 length:711 start_codon:yes stop_codon:yes gene_type:complete